MNTKQLKQFYSDKESKKCQLTEKLIRAGYQQPQGGYIDYAYEKGIKVNYKDAQPSQWWHLVISYCKHTKEDVVFNKRIQCGELIFWMAEAGECVEKEVLNKLVDDIIASGTSIKRINERKPNVRYNRRFWNKVIQDVCFEKIVKEVEKAYMSK